MRYELYTGTKNIRSNTKKYLITGLASILLVFAISMPVYAAGNSKSGLTVGNCMSDILYGNEPNSANGSPGGPAEQDPGSQAGNVLPSQSPGPFVNNPNDPDDPTRGRSAGQWMQEGVNVPALCRTAFGN